MSIWAIADLHLSISTPAKSMEMLSEKWKNYHERIKKNWSNLITDDDLVLIPGDICWASTLDDALLDLVWIDKLPGKKLLLKGNHDYWWGSLNKVKSALPKSISVLQNDVYLFKDTAIGGARLWDTQEYNFNEYIEFQENPYAKDQENDVQVDLQEKIFARELIRLEMSLSKIPKGAKNKIAMTHYPPISADLKSSKTAQILEKYGIQICIFGHLHSIKNDVKMFGEKNNVNYIFAAADYIDFKPLLIIKSNEE